MPSARRSIPVTVLAAALAVGAAACGASGGSAGPGATAGTKAAASPSASADPLAGLTSQQIATRALTDTEDAPGVSIAGTISDSGQTFTLDLTLLRGKGCEGTMAELKQGSFRLIANSTTVWILPDEQFYKSVGSTDAATLAILKGKYLKFKANTNGLAALASLCSLHSLLGGFGAVPAGLSKSATTINGQRAVKLSDTGDSAYIVVSDAGKPELLRMDQPGSGGGYLNFSYGATAAAITPPPASEVLDGSKYGF